MKMNFENGKDLNRTCWEFEYKASVLANAAMAKKAYRQQRADWWQEKQQEVMAEVKESGIEISESVAANYATNAGRGPQMVVRSDLQNKLQECHGKIREHLQAVREYDGWFQVLSANPESILKLKHSDWLFFFGEGT